MACQLGPFLKCQGIGFLKGVLAEASAPCAADKSRKGQSLSSYSALMAEYRNRMGMDRESRSSSLSILAENPSVEPCPCAPCMLTEQCR